MRKKLRTGGLWLVASLCLLMLALTAAFAAPAARADPPQVFPLTAFDFVDTTCGFDVSVHFVLNGEVLRVFSNGSALVTGRCPPSSPRTERRSRRTFLGPASLEPTLMGRSPSSAPGRVFGGCKQRPG
jgi:hypothetical protein